MRTRIVTAITSAVVLSFLISVESPVNANERCSDASLKGSYAFRVDGTNVSNPTLPLGPFAAVGKNTYDGRGHMSGQITISADGAMIPATYTGTYSVAPGCTGTKSAKLNIGATVNFFFVIDSSGRGIKMIVTEAGPAAALAGGLTVTGDATKMSADARRD